MNVRVAIVFLAALLCRPAVLPATLDMEPPPRDLHAEADVVVFGRVKQVLIDHREVGPRVIGLFRATVEVEALEKGDLGDCKEVVAKYYATVKGPSLGLCSPEEYYPLPEQGDLVRVYLQKTPESIYAVVPYKGFEIVEASSREEPTDWAAAATTEFDYDSIEEAILPLTSSRLSPRPREDGSNLARNIVLGVFATVTVASLLWSLWRCPPSDEYGTDPAPTQPQDRS